MFCHRNQTAYNHNVKSKSALLIELIRQLTSGHFMSTLVTKSAINGTFSEIKDTTCSYTTVTFINFNRHSLHKPDI